MTKFTGLASAILLVVCICQATALAQATLTEQRLREEFTAMLTAGTAVQLGDPEQAFLGVFLDAQVENPAAPLFFCTM